MEEEEEPRAQFAEEEIHRLSVQVQKKIDFLKFLELL